MADYKTAYKLFNLKIRYYQKKKKKKRVENIIYNKIDNKIKFRRDEPLFHYSVWKKQILNTKLVIKIKSTVFNSTKN